MLIFTIICMMFSPLFSVPILCLALYNSRHSISTGYAVPFAMLFGAIGYNLNTIGEGDLTRYYMMIDRLQGQKLSYIFANDTDRLYVRDVLFYFVSKTGNNRILAYIVGFCCYLIIFYIFFDTVKRYKVSSRSNCNLHIFLIGLLIMSIINVFSVVGNVRCVFSYILITYAAYRDWIQKKKNLLTILLYVIPIGLHVSTIIILLIRICVIFINKFSKLFFTVAILLPLLIRTAYEMTISLNINNIIFYFIRNAIIKANHFLNWTSGGWADEIENSISDKIERPFGVFFLLIIIILYFICKREKSMRKDEVMCDYIYIVAVVSLGCLSIKTGAFWRFESIVVFFCPSILIPIAMRGNKLCNNLLKILYSSAVIMFVYNVLRFVRNIVMDEFIWGLINTSTFKVVWEMIKGIFAMLGSS